MQPVSSVFPGYDAEETVYAKDQPQYNPLPAVIVDGDPHGRIVTRWHLSDEDRRRVAEGQDVYLSVYTFGNPLQPVLLEVTTADEMLTIAAKEDWPAELIG